MRLGTDTNNNRSRRRRGRRLLFVLGVAGLPAHAAETEPRWELGLGAAGLTIPDYRGSKERGNYVLPLPYGTYTGDVLAVDREGIRGKLFRSERLRLDLSLDAAPPAKSDSGARAGMPQLDPVIEGGVSLIVDFRPHARDGWSLNFPLRAALATDVRHTQSLGWVFSPHIKYAAVHGRLEYDVSAGPLYAAEEHHDYYYEVAPAFAAAGRPAYDARGGYSGSRITFTLSKHFGRFWAGVFARYDDLGGAAFADSPLVETQHAFMAGAAIAWILARSEETVPPKR